MSSLLDTWCDMRAIDKRYLREFLPAMGAYVIVIFTIWPLVNTTDNQSIRAWIALAPVIPVLFVVRAIIRHILSADEMMQHLHLQALAVSAAIVGVVSMLGGFLVAAKVISLDGTILLWVLPALAATFGVVRAIVARRYTRS